MSSDGPPFDRKQRIADTADPNDPSGSNTAESPQATEAIESYGIGTRRSLAGRLSWALVAEIANAVVGLAMFAVLFFFALEEDGYGSFAAVVAIAAIVGPISTFGANWLLIKEVVVSDDVRGDLGRALAKSLIGNFGVVAVSVLVFLALPTVFEDINRLTILLILLGQVPAFWLIELAITTCVAQAKLKLGAQLRLISSGFRLVALVVFGLWVTPTLDLWAWCFAGSTFAAAIVVHVILARINGGPPKLAMPSLKELADGIPYGIGNTTESFLAASDKPILEGQKSQFAEASGQYSAGYRIMSLGLIPLMALLRAQDRRFFRQGSEGSASTHAAAQKMSIMALGATVPVALVLASGEWFIPEIVALVSESWAEKLLVPMSVIRYLALVPILKGFQFSFGNSLTAAGNQTSRLVLTGVAALGNLLANLRYIPTGSWQAAAKTTIGAEICLAIALAIASWYYARTTTSQPSLKGGSKQ